MGKSVGSQLSESKIYSRYYKNYQCDEFDNKTINEMNFHR